MRKIVVDGRTYEWTILQEQVRVRNDKRENFRIPFPPGHGKLNRWGEDCYGNNSSPITPGMVANMIRVHEGRDPVFQKPRPARAIDVPFMKLCKAPPRVIGYVYAIKRVSYDEDCGRYRQTLIEVHVDPAAAKERVSMLNSVKAPDKTVVMLDRFAEEDEKHRFLKDMGVKDAEVRNAILSDTSPQDGPRYVTEEMPLYGAQSG
jgi:hypothetical protein